MMNNEEVADLVQSLLSEGGRVLDAGCGDGSTLELLARRGISGVGVDPNFHGDDALCRKLPAEEIGSLGEPVDLVYCVYALHHFSDPLRFLKQAKMVLGKGGTLLVVDWIKGSKTGVREEYFALEEVEELMADAGFSVLWRKERDQTMAVAGQPFSI